jgi:hypothetical protein
MDQREGLLLGSSDFTRISTAILMINDAIHYRRCNPFYFASAYLILQGLLPDNPSAGKIKVYAILRCKLAWMIKKLCCLVLFILPAFEAPPVQYQLSTGIEIFTIAVFIVEVCCIFYIADFSMILDRKWPIFHGKLIKRC